jgi:hypothetical protein
MWRECCGRKGKHRLRAAVEKSATVAAE